MPLRLTGVADKPRAAANAFLFLTAFADKQSPFQRG